MRSPVLRPFLMGQKLIISFKRRRSLFTIAQYSIGGPANGIANPLSQAIAIGFFLIRSPLDFNFCA